MGVERRREWVGGSVARSGGRGLACRGDLGCRGMAGEGRGI